MRVDVVEDHRTPPGLRLRLLGATLLTVLAMGTLVLFAKPASAETLTVTTTSGTKTDNCSKASCTLPDAVNAAGNGDTINFDSSLGGETISMSLPASSASDQVASSAITIEKSITIEGPSWQNPVTIERSSGGNPFRIVGVLGDVTVNLSNLVLKDGHTEPASLSGGGVAISKESTVTMRYVTVTGGEIMPTGNGGGIWNAGDLTLEGVQVTNNGGSGQENSSGDDTGEGGGIFNKGTLTMNNSAISNNTSGEGEYAIDIFSSDQDGANGGGLYNATDATATVTNSAIEGNQTGYPYAGQGGGIFNESGAKLSLKDTTVSGNKIPLSEGRFPDSDSARGGGIYNDEEASLTLDGVTVANNEASTDGGPSSSTSNNGGGGIYVYQTTDNPVAITNSTITGNSVGPNAEFPSGSPTESYGGGMYVDDSNVTLTNVTVARNTLGGAWCGYSCDSSAVGGGIAKDSDSTVTLENTIVAANTVTTGNSEDGDELYGQYPDLSGTFYSEGYNLLEDTSGASFTGESYDISSDITGKVPDLEPLADNGGPTETLALEDGSPAIDAVERQNCPPPGIDQRGVSRPQGTYCDIGAFEKASSNSSEPASAGRRPESGAADLSFAVGSVLPTVAGLFVIGALGFVGFVLYRHR
ncbi:MAG: choice-of-anchor Q domain-containing protein [Rubrobacteraceae bacterium]